MRTGTARLDLIVLCFPKLEDGIKLKVFEFKAALDVMVIFRVRDSQNQRGFPSVKSVPTYIVE